MNNILLLFLLAFVGIIGYLLYERKGIISQANDEKDKLLAENSRLVKAIIAKNANDYVMTTAIDKVPKEEEPKVADEFIPEETLTDEEFESALGIRRTPIK